MCLESATHVLQNIILLILVTKIIQLNIFNFCKLYLYVIILYNIYIYIYLSKLYVAIHTAYMIETADNLKLR